MGHILATPERLHHTARLQSLSDIHTSCTRLSHWLAKLPAEDPIECDVSEATRLLQRTEHALAQAIHVLLPATQERDKPAARASDKPSVSMKKPREAREVASTHESREGSEVEQLTHELLACGFALHPVHMRGEFTAQEKHIIRSQYIHPCFTFASRLLLRYAAPADTFKNALRLTLKHLATRSPQPHVAWCVPGALASTWPPRLFVRFECMFLFMCELLTRMALEEDAHAWCEDAYALPEVCRDWIQALHEALPGYVAVDPAELAAATTAEAAGSQNTSEAWLALNLHLWESEASLLLPEAGVSATSSLEEGASASSVVETEVKGEEVAVYAQGNPSIVEGTATAKITSSSSSSSASASSALGLAVFQTSHNKLPPSTVCVFLGPDTRSHTPSLRARSSTGIQIRTLHVEDYSCFYHDVQQQQYAMDFQDQQRTAQALVQYFPYVQELSLSYCPWSLFLPDRLSITRLHLNHTERFPVHRILEEEALWAEAVTITATEVFPHCEVLTMRGAPWFMLEFAVQWWSGRVLHVESAGTSGGHEGDVVAEAPPGKTIAVRAESQSNVEEALLGEGYADGSDMEREAIHEEADEQEEEKRPYVDTFLLDRLVLTDHPRMERELLKGSLRHWHADELRLHTEKLAHVQYALEECARWNHLDLRFTRGDAITAEEQRLVLSPEAWGEWSELRSLSVNGQLVLGGGADKSDDSEVRQEAILRALLDSTVVCKKSD